MDIGKSLKKIPTRRIDMSGGTFNYHEMHIEGMAVP